MRETVSSDLDKIKAEIMKQAPETYTVVEHVEKLKDGLPSWWDEPSTKLDWMGKPLDLKISQKGVKMYAWVVPWQDEPLKIPASTPKASDQRLLWDQVGWSSTWDLPDERASWIRVREALVSTYPAEHAWTVRKEFLVKMNEHKHWTNALDDTVKTLAFVHLIKETRLIMA